MQHQGDGRRATKAFGSTPETWLAMQLAFDLDHGTTTCPK